MACTRLPTVAALGACLLLAACGGTSIGREDAIGALQSTGVSEVEATCMADTLLILEELDAADPRVDRGPAEREALVAAMNRCASDDLEVEVAGAQTTVGSETTVESQITVERGAGLDAGSGANFDPEMEETDDLAFAAAPDPMVVEEVRQTGVVTLVTLGRSHLNAFCVVDHVLAVDALHVVAQPNFGLGLDPIEADAFAACAHVE